MFNAKKITDQRQKFLGKNPAFISDNCIGQNVIPYYHIQDDFDTSQSIQKEVNWLIIYYFCHVINDYQDGVIYVIFQIGCNKKHYYKIYG